MLRFKTKLSENGKAFLARSNLDWLTEKWSNQFITTYLFFLFWSTLISLSSFVLRAWDPLLNIEKKLFSRILCTLFVIAAEIYIISLAILTGSWPGTNSRWCSVKKGALKNFANFTGKQLCWDLSLIKLGPATLLKRDSKNLRNL